jgi:two-component system, LytTR family, sensor kinase
MLCRSALEDQGLTLRDAIDVEVLQGIQDTFSKAMCVGAVTVEKDGTPLTRDSGFLTLCRLIRSTEKGHARCMESDAEGGREAQTRGGPYVYRCRGGLLDIAAPIIIQGEYIGCMLCGQVMPTEATEADFEDIVACNTALGLDAEELRRAVREVPLVPRERIDAAAEMLFQVANYIVEMGVVNLMQSRLLEEARERAALQAALQDAQLRMLESQINPHFLFNALGLIGYTAIQEDAQQTQDIAFCLSELLRYSLRNLAVPVTLGQEVEITERYLGIQRLRFGERIKVLVDVDPGLSEVRVPCMVLQPLVENAVVHSVEPLARTVTVRVKAAREGTRVMLEVVDDGVGMDREVLSSVRSQVPIQKTTRPSLGLRNLIRRLQLEYGTAFDFEIESEPGHGTRIVLLIPQSIRHT